MEDHAFILQAALRRATTGFTVQRLTAVAGLECIGQGETCGSIFLCDETAQ